MTSEGTTAIAVSMIFADHIYIDKFKKIFIMGSFNVVSAKTFPCSYSPIWIYQRLTDVTGPSDQKGCFEFLYLDGEQEKIIQENFPVKLNQERLGFSDIYFIFQNVMFPREGKIEILFSLNEEIVNRGILYIQKVEKINSLGENK